MRFREFENHGRKILVEFRCKRCGTTAIRSLEECKNEIDCYNDGLYCLQPPKDWGDGGVYYPLFCPDCKKAYIDFMDGKAVLTMADKPLPPTEQEIRGEKQNE